MAARKTTKGTKGTQRTKASEAPTRAKSGAKKPAKKTTAKKPAKKTTRKPAAPKRTPRKKNTAASIAAAADPLELLAEPLTTPPDPPDRLGAHGLECWRRVAPLLVELRVLTRLDLEALEALCHQWQEYLAWQLKIQRQPSLAIVKYESGARQKSPEATLRDAAYDRWLRMLPRFGLAPEYRRKLKKLREQPAGSGRGSRDKSVEVDPVAAFARQKYSQP